MSINNKGFFMFIRLNRTNKKIAMGLLSFMPEHKDLKELQETMDRYANDENWKLFLWKEEEDFIGIVGVHVECEEVATIHDICVNPSYRNQGIGQKMVRELEEKLAPKTIIETTEDTHAFIEKCHCSKEGK